MGRRCRAFRCQNHSKGRFCVSAVPLSEKAAALLAERTFFSLSQVSLGTSVSMDRIFSVPTKKHSGDRFVHRGTGGAVMATS